MIPHISNADTGILPANEVSLDIPDTLPLMKIDPQILIVSEGNPPYGPILYHVFSPVKKIPP
ncbi:hypothetical protein ES708_24812 [subsurface metagenome]